MQDYKSKKSILIYEIEIIAKKNPQKIDLFPWQLTCLKKNRDKFLLVHVLWTVVYTNLANSMYWILTVWKYKRVWQSENICHNKFWCQFSQSNHLARFIFGTQNQLLHENLPLSDSTIASVCKQSFQNIENR